MAAGLTGKELRWSADSAALHPAQRDSAETLLGAVDFADQPALLFGQAVPRLEGGCADRLAVGQGAGASANPRRQGDRARSVGHGQPNPLRRRGAGRSDLPARGQRERTRAEAYAGSGAAITQIIGAAPFAARFRAVARFDPSAGRLE